MNIIITIKSCTNHFDFQQAMSTICIVIYCLILQVANGEESGEGSGDTNGNGDSSGVSGDSSGVSAGTFAASIIVMFAAGVAVGSITTAIIGYYVKKFGSHRVQFQKEADFNDSKRYLRSKSVAEERPTAALEYTPINQATKTPRSTQISKTPLPRKPQASQTTLPTKPKLQTTLSTKPLISQTPKPQASKPSLATKPHTSETSLAVKPKPATKLSRSISLGADHIRKVSTLPTHRFEGQQKNDVISNARFSSSSDHYYTGDDELKAAQKRTKPTPPVAVENAGSKARTREVSPQYCNVGIRLNNSKRYSN